MRRGGGSGSVRLAGSLGQPPARKIRPCPSRLCRRCMMLETPRTGDFLRRVSTSCSSSPTTASSLLPRTSAHGRRRGRRRSRRCHPSAHGAQAREDLRGAVPCCGVPGDDMERQGVLHSGGGAVVELDDLLPRHTTAASRRSRATLTSSCCSPTCHHEIRRSRRALAQRNGDHGDCSQTWSQT